MDLICQNVSRSHQIILSFSVLKSTKYPNSDRPILIFIIISIPLHMSKKYKMKAKQSD